MIFRDELQAAEALLAAREAELAALRTHPKGMLDDLSEQLADATAERERSEAELAAVPQRKKFWVDCVITIAFRYVVALAVTTGLVLFFHGLYIEKPHSGRGHYYYHRR
jgi:hypothetical protein